MFSGSRSGEIHLHDVRQQTHLVDQLNFHTMEVCGLKWSPDGRYLASGGNDNEVCIWSPLVKSEPVQVLSGHQAAVKVSPLRNTWLIWKTIKLMGSDVLKGVAIILKNLCLQTVIYNSACYIIIQVTPRRTLLYVFCRQLLGVPGRVISLQLVAALEIKWFTFGMCIREIASNPSTLNPR